MKKFKRVFGSVVNLSGGSGQSDDHPSGSPRSVTLGNTRKSISGSLLESGSPQRGSYYSYETQSLDSFNSGLSTTTTTTTQVDPHSKQDKNFTKLHKWGFLGDTIKLRKFIKKVPVDAQDSEGKTALHHAAAQGHGEAVLFLLGSKSNVEMKDNAGMTPFLRAVERSQVHIVQMLLQRRVDSKVADHHKNNSCHLAARTGATELLVLLLDRGGDCDAPNSLGRCPLHVACSENQDEAVEALLRHGAGVNVADKEGVTPLMVAAKMGNVPLVESLLDNGASVSPVDASKWSAADYARFTNHNQLHRRLKMLMDGDGGSGLVPEGLINVSDDGSELGLGPSRRTSEDRHSEGPVGLTSEDRHSEGPSGRTPKDKHSEGPAGLTSEDRHSSYGGDNSWSDSSSDVDSIKEKPKLNLTKFLPSSDESAGNLFASEPSGGVVGPPKPPRLYTSSSSELIDGDGRDEHSEQDREEDQEEEQDREKEQDRGNSLKADDSWKSSSEEEEPKLKSSGLFRDELNPGKEVDRGKGSLGDVVSQSRITKQKGSLGDVVSQSRITKQKGSLGDVVSQSRITREDMLAELGLSNIEYHSSSEDEDISFKDEEEPDLPLEGTPKRVTISRKSSLTPGGGNNSPGEVSPSSISTFRSGYLTSPKSTGKESPTRLIHGDSGENDASPSNLPQSSALGRRRSSVFKESPRRSPPKRRSPRKTRPHLHRSNNFDSDSEECISPRRPHRRKSSTPVKSKRSTGSNVLDQVDWDSEEGRKNKESDEDSNRVEKAIISPKGKQENKEELEDKTQLERGDWESEEESKNKESDKESNRVNKVIISPKVKQENKEELEDKIQLEGENCSIGGNKSSLLVPCTTTGESRTDTLSTVVGTLGRVGTMHEIEEMWESNASIIAKKKSSGSTTSSSIQNSDDSPKDDSKYFPDPTGTADPNTVMEVMNRESQHDNSSIGRDTDDNNDDELRNTDKQKNDCRDEVDNVLETEVAIGRGCSYDDFSSGVDDLLDSKPVLVSPAKLSPKTVPTSLRLLTGMKDQSLAVEEKLPQSEDSISYGNGKKLLILPREDSEAINVGKNLSIFTKSTEKIKLEANKEAEEMLYRESESRHTPADKSEGRHTPPDKKNEPRQTSPENKNEPRHTPPDKKNEPRHTPPDKKNEPRHTPPDKKNEPRHTPPDKKNEPRHISPDKKNEPRHISPDKKNEPRQTSPDKKNEDMYTLPTTPGSRGSVVFSDDDSIDHSSTPRGPEEPDDGAASTETEESAHINSGLKDCLLTPLSSLPDASDVGQLQDLVRELRLKLEKEFGRRVALETRVSNIQLREKNAKVIGGQLEVDLQRRQQEISTLTARIRQLEYQGRHEQDSSRLKDQSLQDFHQQCVQLEEQCSQLRTHAQHQEQLVDSLMAQLQTKERVNDGLRGRLEELSSQTKYVSMKSCQTEETYFCPIPSTTAHVQTDATYSTQRESNTQTDALPTTEHVLVQTEENYELKDIWPQRACDARLVIGAKTASKSTQTQEIKDRESKYGCMVDMAAQTEVEFKKVLTNTQVQCTPERSMKSSQTHAYTQSRHMQTQPPTGSSCPVEEDKRIVCESSCQAAVVIRQTGVQTDPVNPLSESGETVHVEMIASAIEPALQDFSHAVEALITEAGEASQTSTLEKISKTIINQIDKLGCNINDSLHQASTIQCEETCQRLSEGLSHIQDILEGQLDTVIKVYSDNTAIYSGDLKGDITQVSSDIQCKLDHLRKELNELQSSQESSQQVVGNMAASITDLKETNGEIWTCVSDHRNESKDSSSRGFDDLKEQLVSRINELVRAVESSGRCDDSGASQSPVREIVDKLETLEKSLTLSMEKNYIANDISGIQQVADDILKKIYIIEQSLQGVNNDMKSDQATLDERINDINESNKRLTHLLRSRTSETSLSEALEENFQIIQDHLRRLQQTLLQRINEVSEHVNVSEDQKASWLSKQVMEMTTQISGMQSGLLRVQSSLEAAQSSPSSSGIIDDTLISSLRATNEQAISTLKFQNDSIIKQLEALQNELRSTVTQGQISRERREVCLLKEAINDKDNELALLISAKETLQDKLRQQTMRLEDKSCKDEEQKLRIESLQEKLEHLEGIIKEKEQKIHQEATKNVDQSADAAKARQENFRLSSENAKLGAALQAEQQQRQWHDGELRVLRDAQDTAEAKIRELMERLQQASMERTPPTGRDDDDDAATFRRQQEVKKLEAERQEAENRYNEERNRTHRLELRVKEAEATLGLEKNNRLELEKQLTRAKEALTAHQRELSQAGETREALQDMEEHKKELEIEIESRDTAIDALRKKIDDINKEKLDLKQSIMILKGEKLSFELVKQEKELAEQMQKKTEEQLQELQRQIPREFVSKKSLQLFHREIENKYQLEMNAKLTQLNRIIQDQNKQQESLARTKISLERGLRNEIDEKSEEIIRLRARLSLRDEDDDTWKLRHDRLMGLYQHQSQTNHDRMHKISQTKRQHQDSQQESFSISLQEIDKHLKTPYATSTLLGQLTPPTSLHLPKAPSNIDSYHYTHSESLERTLHKYLSTDDKPRSLPNDDKPRARISPMQPSPHGLQRDGLPTLDQTCEDYVDLLKKKYGL